MNIHCPLTPKEDVIQRRHLVPCYYLNLATDRSDTGVGGLS